MGGAACGGSDGRRTPERRSAAAASAAPLRRSSAARACRARRLASALAAAKRRALARRCSDERAKRHATAHTRLIGSGPELVSHRLDRRQASRERLHDARGRGASELRALTSRGDGLDRAPPPLLRAVISAAARVWRCAPRRRRCASAPARPAAAHAASPLRCTAAPHRAAPPAARARRLRSGRTPPAAARSWSGALAPRCPATADPKPQLPALTTRDCPLQRPPRYLAELGGADALGVNVVTVDMAAKQHKTDAFLKARKPAPDP